MKKVLLALVIASPLISAPVISQAKDFDPTQIRYMQRTKAILGDLHDALQKDDKNSVAKALCRMAEDVLEITSGADDELGGIAGTLLGTFAKGDYWNKDQEGQRAFAGTVSSAVVSKFYELLKNAGDWKYDSGVPQYVGQGNIMVRGDAGKVKLQLFFRVDSGKVYDVMSNGVSLIKMNRDEYASFLRQNKANPQVVSALVANLRGPGGLPILCN